MAILNNLNTQQTPIVSGLTGAQSIKFIHADRVYVKASDSTPTPPTAKSDGTLPEGYTDLGILNNVVKISYSKTNKEVRTGIDEVLRAVYSQKKTAEFSFSLSQFDDVVMGGVTGLTASEISAGSAYSFAVGSEDVVQLALLLVSQNKLDGKEWQFYAPNAYMSFDIADSSGELVLNVKGDLPLFPWLSSTAIFVQTIHA